MSTSVAPPVEADVGDGEQDQWEGLESSIQDPEEMMVLYCALDSFLQYAKVAHFNSTHLRRQSFYALPRAHWELLAQPPFNYLDTLNAIDDAIDSNADLARAIVQSGLQSFSLSSSASPTKSVTEPALPEAWQGVALNADVDKARSTLRQFYRDWSAAGAAEREACYGPVMKALDRERARVRVRDADVDVDKANSDSPLKVLVPGAGLGRLVFDLCVAGYETEGNEISYHQLLASRYILNSTKQAGQHTIFPWVHGFSNHRTRANQLASCLVPDIHPATELQTRQREGCSPHGSMTMCAADFLCLYSDEEHQGYYDAVATVFFLDTAPNLVRYLETIRSCLKPGGLLVNFGPLLWHFENNAPGNHGRDDDGDGEHNASNSNGIADPGSFELTDVEVMALVERMGFKIEESKSGIEAPYIADTESMLHLVYKASFWVARKVDLGEQCPAAVPTFVSSSNACPLPP